MPEYLPFEKQKQFNTALKSGKYKFLLYGGGVRSGKSYNQIMILLGYALAYPGTRWVILRKTLVNLKRTSIKTFKKICFDLKLEEVRGRPAFSNQFNFNHQDNIVTFKNGSSLEFMESDIARDPELYRLRGLEVDGGLMEECNEMDESVFNVMVQRIGQWSKEFKYNQRAFLLLNCNPSPNWVKNKFYEPWAKGELATPFYYQPALPVDNPHNTKEYLDSLTALPPQDYKTYVLGDWDAFNDPNQLILSEWLERVWITEHTPARGSTIFLGVDVAREGDDRSILYFYDATAKVIFGHEAFSKLDGYALAMKIYEAIKKYNIGTDHVYLDVVGVGGGPVDILRHNGLKVKAYNSGEAPSKKHAFYTFLNKKAELNYFVAELIRRGEIKIVYNETTKNELLSIRYTSNDKTFKIESKSEAKKRLGRSPDMADALVICLCPLLYRSHAILA